MKQIVIAKIENGYIVQVVPGWGHAATSTVGQIPTFCKSLDEAFALVERLFASLEQKPFET